MANEEGFGAEPQGLELGFWGASAASGGTKVSEASVLRLHSKRILEKD
ncbi:hypothetical protein IRB23M11_20860 [Alkalibacterium sp. m-11]